MCVGPALDDVPIQAYTYGGGRVIRLDMTLEGKPRSYLFVYAPCERADRPRWFTNFAACMPVSREVIIMGDFNTRMSKLDHQHGRAPNAGHEDRAPAKAGARQQGSKAACPSYKAGRQGRSPSVNGPPNKAAHGRSGRAPVYRVWGVLCSGV